MKNKNIRLRFAPSPTGFLHIGGLRAALFNYLAAKSLGGKLILRIEDTDQKREVGGAVDGLISILDWAGLNFDEGPRRGGDYGPYVQSERLDVYKKHSEQLLSSGKAYRCFCSAERLASMREEQAAQKMPPRYDGACRNLNDEEIKNKLSAGESFVVRQKMPKNKEVIAHDELRGDIKFKADDLDDHVLVKSDGFPTYQLANVVDDYEMAISHVIRGDEWLSSFPKNILLYEAFGWTAPKFIHTPLVLDKAGGKLSKRKGDVAVEDYRAKGYLPEAIINFCALLGWHPKGDKEIFSLKELEKEFNIKNIGISPAIFDIDKLDYLNGYYIRQKPIKKLVELCKPYLIENIKITKDKNKQSDEFIIKIIKLEQERLKKLSEIGDMTKFFFVDKLEYAKEMLVWKKMDLKSAQNNLKIIYELLEKITEKNWSKEYIEKNIIEYIQSSGGKVGEYLWPMRVGLTGEKASPGPFEVAEILGKNESMERLKEAIS